LKHLVKWRVIEGLSKSFSQLSFGLVNVFMGPPARLRKLVI
jgi:hypothetical protein